MTNTTATSEPTPALGGNAGMSSEYLEVRNLSVSFDGFKAVDGVDLTLMQGDLRFLIGERGWKDNVGRRHHRTRSRDGFHH